MHSVPSESRQLDVAVVGAGPAGLAAGIHLARVGLSHQVFERREPGGLLRSAGLVECYPGFPGGVQAPVLVEAMVDHARGLGVCLTLAEVLDLSWTGASYELQVGSDSWLADTVVLATGTLPRPFRPGLAGEVQARARVQYETAALPQRLEGQRVWISGAGDAAFDSALQLVERGALVELGLRGQAPRALALLVRRARERGVRLHTGCELRSAGASGDGLRLELTMATGAADQRVDWLLICHGRDPDHLLWHRLASSAARGPHQVESHYPGLFMAGDMIRGGCRYAAVAAGDGLRCARLAEAHLERYRARSPDPLPGST